MQSNGYISTQINFKGADREDPFNRGFDGSSACPARFVNNNNCPFKHKHQRKIVNDILI